MHDLKLEISLEHVVDTEMGCVHDLKNDAAFETSVATDIETDTDFFIEIALLALVMVETEAAAARFDANARLEDVSTPSTAAALRKY